MSITRTVNNLLRNLEITERRLLVLRQRGDYDLSRLGQLQEQFHAALVEVPGVKVLQALLSSTTPRSCEPRHLIPLTAMLLRQLLDEACTTPGMDEQKALALSVEELGEWIDGARARAIVRANHDLFLRIPEMLEDPILEQILEQMTPSDQLGVGIERLIEGLKGVPAVDAPADSMPVIMSLGDRRYQVGNNAPIVVTNSEDNVLQALAQSSPKDEPALRERSGQENAAKLLHGLRKKYDGTFRDAIRCPGGKAKGGYHAIVRPQT